MSLLGRIVRHALTTPHRLAVLDDRREYTYAQLVAGAMFLAERLDAVCDRPRVGLMLPTSGAFPMALLGAWLARRSAVAFNYLLNRDELGFVLGDSGVDTLITAGPLLDHLGGACSLPSGLRVLKVEEMDFSGVPPLRWPPHPPRDSDAAMLYTSGTSGRPKGVVLTHGNLESNALGGIEHARIREADVFLGVLPQFHSFGLTGLTLIPLVVGARVVYTARFMPRRVVELIRKHRPAVVMGVPSMYAALLAVKDAVAEDFASIRFAVSGGEPLPAALAEEYRQRFNFRLLEGYGLTETSPVTTWSTPYAHKPGSVGTPLPGVSVITVDDRDQVLPPGAGAGSEGEVLIAGPNVMKGYHGQPGLTAEVVTTAIEVPPGHPFRGPAMDARAERWRGRWFRTGDLGRIDDEGFLSITGRKKEMLKVAGEMVIPREVEEVLARHPSVKAAAVVGKSDGVRGEVPIAFVETREGQVFDETALRAWCRENLAGYKVPREVRHIDALPRNATGKVLRRQLKAD